MKRTPLKRKRALTGSRRTAVRNRNAKRQAAEFARAYGSPERVAWIQAHPSIVSGQTPCENAHIVSGGTGRKAAAEFIVPLTAAEHRELHSGAYSFQFSHRLNLLDEAAKIEAEYQRYRAGERQELWGFGK